jgi:hypothetical protein
MTMVPVAAAAEVEPEAGRVAIVIATVGAVVPIVRVIVVPHVAPAVPMAPVPPAATAVVDGLRAAGIDFDALKVGRGCRRRGSGQEPESETGGRKEERLAEHMETPS